MILSGNRRKIPLYKQLNAADERFFIAHLNAGEFQEQIINRCMGSEQIKPDSAMEICEELRAKNPYYSSGLSEEESRRNFELDKAFYENIFLQEDEKIGQIFGYQTREGQGFYETKKLLLIDFFVGRSECENN